MTIKKTITKLAKRKKKIQTSDVQEETKNKYSRQYIVRNLKELTDEKVLLRFSAGAGTFYSLPENVMSLSQKMTKRLKNKDLDETQVYLDFEKKLHLKETLDENVYSIITYAFAEMLNNAIEHSTSDWITISYFDNKDNLTFVIGDYGIGAFRNVMESHGLQSEIEAIQDILKGKTTTAPLAHSGQGIFFTSKIADLFILESYSYRLRIDNSIPDLFIEKLPPTVQGTKVTFTIQAKTTKSLSDVFRDFQTDPEGFDFDKTKIHVKLYTMGSLYVSRSQARRISVGLEKYRHIVLDFQKISTVGQAFADELFRVFQSRHKEIVLEPINMNETVEFMIKRVNSY